MPIRGRVGSEVPLLPSMNQLGEANDNYDENGGWKHHIYLPVCRDAMYDRSNSSFALC